MKPARLREGDTLGIISPSWGGGAAYPHRVERGVEYLESLGFRVRIAPHAMNSAGYVSDTAENRAKYGQPLSRAGKRTAARGN